MIDLLAFVKDDVHEYLSVGSTNLGLLKIRPEVGDQLLTNSLNPIIEIVEDTVGVHDTLVTSCNPGMYAVLGLPDHPSCRMNFKQVLEPYGIEEWWQPEPFNIFQNTPVNPNGTLEVGEPPSKAGDYITFKILVDSLVALSVCPFVLEGFNGGKSTPVQVSIK